MEKPRHAILFKGGNTMNDAPCVVIENKLFKKFLHLTAVYHSADFCEIIFVKQILNGIPTVHPASCYTQGMI